MQRARREAIHPETCRRLLDQLDHDRPAQPLFIPQTGETLTSREVEVLRLLVDGASNRQIGEQLVIALPTVRTHVSRILRKLGGDGRTAAAARVREWQLYL